MKLMQETVELHHGPVCRAQPRATKAEMQVQAPR